MTQLRANMDASEKHMMDKLKTVISMLKTKATPEDMDTKIMTFQHKWNEYLETRVDELLASDVANHQITDVIKEMDIEAIAKTQVKKNILSQFVTEVINETLTTIHQHQLDNFEMTLNAQFFSATLSLDAKHNQAHDDFEVLLKTNHKEHRSDVVDVMNDFETKMEAFQENFKNIHNFDVIYEKIKEKLQD